MKSLLVMLVMAMLLNVTGAMAQMLENSQTKATAGTVGTPAQKGRASNGNMSTGGQGPTSENKTDLSEGGSGKPSDSVPAGGANTTNDLFEH